MNKQVGDRGDVAERRDSGKVIQFHPRETSIGKPNWEKAEKPAEVIELTKERIESMAKRPRKTKAEEKPPVPLPWFGFF